MYGYESSNYFSEASRPHYYDWERPKKGRERVHPFGEERKLYQALQVSHKAQTNTSVATLHSCPSLSLFFFHCL